MDPGLPLIREKLRIEGDAMLSRKTVTSHFLREDNSASPQMGKVPQSFSWLRWLCTQITFSLHHCLPPMIDPIVHGERHVLHQYKD